jgi:hypothetical protein
MLRWPSAAGGSLFLVPGRGYWARVDAGQKPYRPKLPKREPRWGDQQALTVQVRESDDQVVAGETTASEGLTTIRERIAAETRRLAH